MSKKNVIFLCLTLFSLLLAVTGKAYANNILHGVITDTQGPVSGAEVAVYKGSNIKKPADFVSGKTGEDGRYQVAVPPGQYWLVAFLRRNSNVGPLGLNDKYSGEAVQVKIDKETSVQRDFLILNLREAAMLNDKKNSDLVEVSGRILDKGGKPVQLAYAMASRAVRFKGIPEFVSAWNNAKGEYILFLPRGKYYLGAATGFPPDSGYISSETIFELDKDRQGVDLVVAAE